MQSKLHGGAHAAVGYSYTTVLEVSLFKELFRNFANGSERKGLSTFTGY